MEENETINDEQFMDLTIDNSSQDDTGLVMDMDSYSLGLDF